MQISPHRRNTLSNTNNNTKQKIPDNQIYKAHILDADGTRIAMIVFSRSNPIPITYKGINEIELDEKNIVFSDLQIHLDDSIQVIKKKILFELEKSDILTNSRVFLPKCAYEELYLFGKMPEIDKNNDPNSVEQSSNEFITRDISIGNKGNIEHINPYSINLTEPLPKIPKQVVFENTLLLNYPVLYENDIYVCLAENVLEYVRQSTQPNADKYIIQSYFPLLREKGIDTQIQLQDKKSALWKETKKLLNASTKQLYRTVQLFYDVYNSTERNTQYIRKGIQSVYFRMHSGIKTRVNDLTEDEEIIERKPKVLPLDIIFKLIHCSKTIPFIKFNPGNRRENLYRLYYEKMTPDGKKIPLLSVKQIHKLARETGRSNQITLYLQLEHGSPPVYVHFEQNGDISVQCVLSKPRTQTDLDELLKEILNPVISALNVEFRQTGYTISHFHSLNEPNVHILDLKYVASVNITRNVKINDIDCIYSLLTVNKARGTDEPIVRYKRVENYKEMTAETALITELYNTMRYTEMTGAEMIDIVSQRFGLSEEQARSRVVDCLSSTHEYNGEIVEHPGFPMKIQIAKFESNLEFEIESIDSVRYIEPIEVYIESIIKMTQEIRPSSQLGTYITRICNNSKKIVQEETSHVENMIITDTLGKEKRPMAIQPFALENMEEFDIFRELGVTDDYDETEHDILDLEEEPDEEDVSELLTNLYKNTNMNTNTNTNIVEPSATPQADTLTEYKDVPTRLYETITSILPSGIMGETSSVTPETLENTLEISEKETISKKEKEDMQEERNNETEEEMEEGEDEQISDDDSDDEKGVFFESDDEETLEGGATATSYATATSGAPTTKPVAVNPKLNDISYNGIPPDDRSLKHPNPFLRKMQSLENTLFLTKPQGKKYKSYSASCQPTSRHPVILTDAEKEKIDKEHPGSYKHAIKYGTDPKKPYWYICPRYWCFLTNTSVSEEYVKSGKCGTIIPDNVDVIPPGAYVYEFKGDEHTDVKGNYIEHHPGFLKDGKHPDGYCLPCCFKNWDKSGQPQRREQCRQQTSDAISSSEDASQNAVATTTVQPQATAKQPPKSALYVISLDTYPVPHTRWGFTPIAIQLFFNIDYKTVVDKNNSAIVTPNTPTFLRYGVEQIENQSFLGVFADIYAYQQRQLAIPSVAEFKSILSKHITLDVFVRAHNSSLVSVFRTKNRQSTTETPEIPAKYMESEFAKRLDITKPEQLDFLNDTVSAYENFIAYINHPTEAIDHTYLWDIFTSDIDGLNRGGVNLVLLEIMENDVTDNIQLVCPTNSYSKQSYDPRKETVFVLKHDTIYEPIYLYEFVKKEGRVGISAQRTFSEKTIHKNIKQLLTNIVKTSNRYCSPLPSLPRVYEFSEPITLELLIEQIYKHNYIPVAQVVNYRNKVIGVLVRFMNTNAKTEQEIMLPCFPSAPSNAFTSPVPIKTMDDETVWKDYYTTRDAFKQIYEETKHVIPCLPRIKVMEDELVVGFLTSTNQFIQIIPPLIEQVDDGIPVHRTANHVTADNSITTTSIADKSRVETMKRIRLENQFYLAFRSTIRNLLNDYIYRKKRNAIMEIINSQTHLYKQKIEQLEAEIRSLVSNRVIFVDIEMDVLMELNEIVECDADAEDNPYCLLKENGVSQLSIPKWNLLSEKTDNEDVYYIRIADELLRNNRVRLFMFDPEKYFNLADVQYHINTHEFILSQTALHGNYFTDMKTFNTTDFVQNTNYDTAMPSVSQLYANTQISVQEQYAEPVVSEETVECIEDPAREIVGNMRSIWKRSFPKTALEIVYKNTVSCSFFVLIAILKQHTGITHSILQIKEKLWNGYSRIFEKKPDEYLEKIVGVLRRQGKKALMEPVVKHKITFESLLFSEDYYISDMDIWVIAETYQVPIILFSSMWLKGFTFKVEWLKCGGNVNDKYYFIRSTIRMDKPNGVGNYHLINSIFAFSELREFYTIVSDALQGNPEYARNIRSIENTLDNIEFIPKNAS